MLIDWFTVGAQLVNFVILVWLLQHFLYRPILAAIDAREKRIATELADAAAKQLAANQEHASYDAKSQTLDQQRAELLSKAAEQARTDGERLMSEARASAVALRETQAKALLREQQDIGASITQLASDEVFAIARKALGDLASADLEERIGEVFTRRLGTMDAGSRTTLAAAIHDSAEPVLVRSAFALPPPVRATIQNALNETFARELPLRFETAPTVVCGIEMSVSGQKFGWSIAEYLHVLEQRVSALLDAQSSPVGKAPVPPVPAPEVQTAVAT